MEASSQRTTGQVRMVLMLIIGVAAAVACVVTLMLWKAPVASAQEEGPTGESFVVKCGFSHERQVDPIVAFGPSDTNPDGTPVTPPTTPSAHMHHFFGNTTTDSNSTYDTLRAGGTTCDDPMDKAAYWIPTVSWTDSSGTHGPFQATQEFFYYKLGGKGVNITVNPHPALNLDQDVQLDDGLKIVTVHGKNVEWRCANGNWSTTPPRQCSNGKLMVRIKFPDCLAVDANKQPLLDTGTDPRFPNDHRSHMVDSVQSQDGNVKKCPSTHPYPVPMLQTNFTFQIPSTRGTVKLSTVEDSGRYSTMHADFFNAWDQVRLKDLVDRCINAAPFTSENPKPIDCQ
jgi:Domain of unknown function (DUF1996)